MISASLFENGCLWMRLDSNPGFRCQYLILSPWHYMFMCDISLTLTFSTAVLSLYGLMNISNSNSRMQLLLLYIFIKPMRHPVQSLRWRHNEHHCVSNHHHYHCLLNRLFGCRSKKISKLRVTGLCGGIHRGPVNSPHKGPMTRKMFPFDDVIMMYRCTPKHRPIINPKSTLIPAITFLNKTNPF